MKVLLDTNILLLRPQILARRKEGITLVIPFSVRTELTFSSFTRTGVTQISQLVDEAIRAGNAQIETLSTVPSLEDTSTLSGTDIELITLAQELAGRGEEVVLASQDRAVAKSAATLNIRCIDLNELEELLSENAVLDQDIDGRAKKLLTSQMKNLIIHVATAAAASVIGNVLWAYSKEIVATISIWGTILAIILIGVFAYAIRGRFRFTYGVFEFVFGATLGIRVFFPSFDYEQLNPSSLLQLVAGIYVMVRGQDNIGKALRGSRFGPTWARLSGER
jgi:hypothetical protein